MTDPVVTPLTTYRYFRVTIKHDQSSYEFDTYFTHSCSPVASPVFQTGATFPGGTPYTIGPWTWSSDAAWENTATQGRNSSVPAGQPVTWDALWEQSDSASGPWTQFHHDFFTPDTTVSGYTSWSCVSAGPYVPPTPCVYGTQPTPGATVVTIITAALVDAVCTALGAAWLSLIFDPLIGLAFETGVLCGTGPPDLGTITPEDLLSSVESAMACARPV